jgi:NAD(P)H dehydrogenase (quinone)
MILVTGATGHLGTATVEHLLKKTKADSIAALARSEEKAKALRDKGVEVRIGDFDDIASLDKAMRGIEKVLLISTIDPNRLQQHKNVVDAAKRAGVHHIAYTSVSMNDLSTSAIIGLMESHFQTEDYIRNSGLSFTFLRNTLYIDVIPFYVGEQVFETGIYFPADTGTVPFALRSEMGEATANVLFQDGHENKTYAITGNTQYSFKDIANELSALSGKTVTYTDANVADYTDKLKQFDVPEYLINMLSGFATDIKNKQFEIVSNDLESLLGRKPASLKEGLKLVYNL